MGAGASTARDAVSVATDQELRTAVAQLPSEQKRKLQDLLRQGDHQPSTPQQWSEELRERAKRLELPDSHLLYGVTVQAARDFAELVKLAGFDRKAYFDRAGKADWITSSYGAELVGYDFALCIRSWMEEHDKRQLSGAEVLAELGNAGVGPATVFVSHVQCEPLEATLKVVVASLSVDKKCWLDYVVLRQCVPDFSPTYVETVIQSISYTLAVEDEANVYLTRSFCLFELAATPDEKLKFPLNTYRRECKQDYEDMAEDSVSDSSLEGLKCNAERHLWQVAVKVDSCAASATRQEDKVLVDKYIESRGGFKKVDSSISRAIRQAWDD
eukprot:TRINITY_DN47923_c0_g1_i1.p1 TRINITY_DN47923_c0_g1~~TRINITY_DN47923_c0_g1_i1.p1  ORF type:complete len:355 (+),score=47.61 TRINITY_DN47923_c0_g1_i1:82-1065(+)